MTTQPDQDPTLQEKLRHFGDQSDIHDENQMMRQAADRIDQLERQLAKAQKNAERYLFVRNETSNLDFGLINNGWILEGSKADEIIDAAIAQQKVKS